MNMTRRAMVSVGGLAAACFAGLFARNKAYAVEPASVTPATDPTAMPIPAHTVPVPDSVSPEGQAFLKGSARRINDTLSGNPPPPLPGGDEAMLQYFRSISDGFEGTSETIELPSGGRLYRLTPEGRTGRHAQVAYFDIHGGGFVSGGGEAARLLGMARARDYGVEVFAVDYRLLPDHPYPAGLDDCVAAFRTVLDLYPADAVVVGGSSAGGNLAAAMLHRARAENLPFPGGLLLLTPATDLTRSGDSYTTNRYLDVIIGDGYQQEGTAASMGYGSNADRADPMVSPLFGDVSGWPPTLLSTGTRDLLLSDTVRMHRQLRRAGVDAALHVTEAGPHGGFQGRAPEDREVLAECAALARKVWGLDAS